MKFSLLFLFLILINGQHGNVEGEYFNHFGSQLKINSDSTFLYNWHFDTASSWTQGKWVMQNDTIYFKVIPVFDTLRRTQKKDTLILSIDRKPELITERNGSITHFVSTGGQNFQKMNLKLYFKDDKLFEIKKNGKLVTKKKKEFWQHKEYDTWFVKK